MADQHPYSPGTVVLALGTKRGLFLATSADRVKWDVHPTSLEGHRIFHAILDQRAGRRLFAADNGDFFGNFIRYSDDWGQTWQEPKQGIQFPQEGDLALKNIWVIEPGRANEPHTVYAGVDPASLWVSRDRGETWEPNNALLTHPTRARWEPGAGGLCLHTIIADPSKPSRMWVGISAVGCLRSDDGGQNWVFANKNTRADFLPDRYPEFGQCIHRLVQHPTRPDILYQQNHCGVYKSTNGGEDWIDIQQNLPSDFGFPIALDTHHPETVFVIVEDGRGRYNFGNQFTVYRTTNSGEHWEPLSKGLPTGSQVKLGVLRHGMCTDSLNPCGVYVGTNTGQLFASPNGGDTWELLADFLPPIYSVTAAVLE
ncbi:MAG TPA: sialidase family protein [Ktedonobacterales bacterium]|jgi:photosystem II stability/assembly factor-like uncharacterized protein